MMRQHRYEPELPQLTLSSEELFQILKTVLKGVSGSIDFGTIKSRIANHIVKFQIGFSAASDISYTPTLNEIDVSRVREAVWDLIIMRYLTVGSYGSDVWPSLTVTERGQAYFNLS
ncbi:hypothetical protein [Mucilaginibacter sp.]